jgi:hypothetical protein
MPNYPKYANVELRPRRVWGAFAGRVAFVAFLLALAGAPIAELARRYYPAPLPYLMVNVAYAITASAIIGALLFAFAAAPLFGRYSEAARLALQDIENAPGPYPFTPMGYMGAGEEDMADAEADERARRYAGEYGEAVDFVVWAARNFLTRQATRDEPAALAKLHDGVTELDTLDRALGLAETTPRRAEYVEALEDVARAADEWDLDTDGQAERRLRDRLMEYRLNRDAAAVRTAAMESDIRDWTERGDAAARERLEGAMGVSLT